MIYNFPNHISGDTFRGINAITLLENGIPINLTNCSIYMQFRSIFNLASPVVFEFSSDEGTIGVVVPENGVVSIPEQVIIAPAGEYDYDLQVMFPDGSVKTYLKGKFKILPQITRIKIKGSGNNILTPTPTPTPTITPTPDPSVTATITPTPTPTSLYNGYSC
jgi:hypothetical protein